MDMKTAKKYNTDACFRLMEAIYKNAMKDVINGKTTRIREDARIWLYGVGIKHVRGNKWRMI